MNNNNNSSTGTNAREQDAPALVPTLRFPEFQGAAGWSLQKGNTLFDQINNRNPEPGLPILAITQEHGAIPRQMIDYHVSVSEKSIESYKVVRIGDFIISLRSFQGGIEYSRYHGICSPAYVILRRRGNGTDEYFRHYLKTDRFIQILTKNLEGLRDGKMISYSQFSDLLIPTPTLAEQQRIADCLSSLDALIAAQARKVDALKTHKRGLMQQLFPRAGETQPRLRFPEFRGTAGWEVTTLGKHVIIQRSYNPTDQSLFSKRKYAFVKVEDLNNCIKYQLSGREFHDYSDALIPTNSVVFPKRGAAIELNKIRITAIDILIDTNLMALTPKDELNVEFLFYYLSRIGLSQIADTSTIPQINNKHIIPFDFLLPTLAEQQRIADCLSSLDTLIAAAAQQLESLKTHKRGLMQQLFPSLEEVES